MTHNKFYELFRVPKRYKHDCPNCVYLGQYGNADLYACGPDLYACGPDAEESYEDCCEKVLDTVIARYSDDPADYASGIHDTLLDNLSETHSYKARFVALKRAIFCKQFRIPQWFKNRLAERTLKQLELTVE